MNPMFGWSMVGAEQNPPDTLNNTLFGPIETTPSLSNLFIDPPDDSSSFGYHATSRDDEQSLNGNNNNTPFYLNNNETEPNNQDLPSTFPFQEELRPSDPSLLPANSIYLPYGDIPISSAPSAPRLFDLETRQDPVGTEVQKIMEPAPLTPSLSVNPFSTLMGADSKAGSKKKLHNTSEKRRVERLNAKIDELYNIITSTGPLINKSKINILLETIKFIRHLQSQIQELKDQLNAAQKKADRRLDHVNEMVASQKINYHVLFLQSPVPMAVLSTDGQFIDANSQFCCIIKTTLENLKTMTLFRVTHPEDLPCAFGSYSYMLYSDLEAPSQCIIRHCVLGGTIQPVYFSLSLIRDNKRNPIGFTCTILPVLSCDCTGNCNASRTCSGQLRSKQGKYYFILNPPDTIPCCSKLVGAITGINSTSCPKGCLGVCYKQNML